MSITGTTVWPNDVVVDPRELERASPHRLVCFLLSPFDPPEVFNPVHDAVRAACNLCASPAGIEIPERPSAGNLPLRGSGEMMRGAQPRAVCLNEMGIGE
jgi:hypothetical protein